MGVDIHLHANEVWKFAMGNKLRLKEEQVCIAENSDTGISVYLTYEEDCKCPWLFAYRHDEKVDAEGVISEKDCENTVKRYYLKHLFPVVVPFKDTGEKQTKKNKKQTLTKEEQEAIDSLNELDDKMYEREDAIIMATQDFLDQLCGVEDLEEDLDLKPSDILDIAEYVCEHLATEYGISIYWPQWITDDDTKCEEYVEFPFLAIDE